MKLHKKILFRIIFFLVALFCFEITTHSNYNIHQYIIEYSADKNNVANNFSSDIDSFDEDQINHINEFSLFAENRHQLIIPQNCFLILNPYFSIWQPPKI